MSNKEVPSLSIIIPTLNEAGRLRPVLDALDPTPGDDIIIADGGSNDDTDEIAAAQGTRFIVTRPGRGRQLATGADAATGEWLLFLHADTRLSNGWRDAALGFMTAAQNSHRAAVFQFRLDDDAAPARRLEKMVAWRNRTFGLPYGDQALLISQHFYKELGGFKELPLMEDVDLIRRIGGHRITFLDAEAVTSADRYKKGGYFLRPLRNLTCLALYFAGLPPRTIERLYR